MKVKFLLPEEKEKLSIKFSTITIFDIVLITHGINNVFCRGNIWARDKAIRDFTTKEHVKIIMLSSASAAAGTNLTAATKVILLEPVNGTYDNGVVTLST